MIDQLLHDLQLLRKADLLVGKIWLDALTRRLGLLALAGVIAAFGLAMANVAGYLALQASLGSVRGAMVVALFDLVVAALVFAVARRSHPGPELELALDVRKIAVESIRADGHDLKRTLDALGHEIASIKASLARLSNDPLDAAAQKLLVPVTLSIVRALRSSRGHE